MWDYTQNQLSRKEKQKRKKLRLQDRFRSRRSTYKTLEAQWRSFYKYVCKRNWYYNIRYDPELAKAMCWHPFGCGWDYVCDYRSKHTCGNYSGRYPVFRDWRSSAYESWNWRFLNHLQRWEEEDKLKWEQERAAAEQKYLQEMKDARKKHESNFRKRLHRKETVRFFRMLAAVTTIEEDE